MKNGRVRPHTIGKLIRLNGCSGCMMMCQWNDGVTSDKNEFKGIYKCNSVLSCTGRDA